MIQRSAPAFPEALDDDDDDVTWALQTAGVQWKRGAHADAIEWLHRAVESAVDGGRAIRAREIQQQANNLEAALKSGWRPQTSAPPPVQRPAARNPFLDDDDGTDSLSPYSELPVDIDVEASFKLRSQLPSPQSMQAPAQNTFAPARSAGPPESVAAEEVDEEELIEEVEEFEEDEIASLPVGRLPFVSAPTLETGEIEDDFVEPDEHTEDQELPTLPPSVRGLAPPGRARVPTSPPRPPNLPPTPSWPPPPSNRPPTLPPPSAAAWQQAPASNRPRARRSSPSSSPAPKLAPRASTAQSLSAPPARTAPQITSSAPPVRTGQISAPPARVPPARTSPQVTSSTPPARGASSAPPVRGASSAPPHTPVPASSSDAPTSDAPASRQPRSSRRPSARALALEKKIAAAKALARQRMLEAADSEPDEPTERSMEVATPAPNALDKASSLPPADDFQSVPPDETTERTLEGPPGPVSIPRSALESLPDSDPGTSPDIRSPFARSEPPPSSDEDSARRDSSQPPTESDPALPPPSSLKISEPPVPVFESAPPSLEISEVSIPPDALGVESGAPAASASRTPASAPPESVTEIGARRVATSSLPPISAPESAPLISIPLVTAPPGSAPLISLPPESAPLVSIPLITAPPQNAAASVAPASEPASARESAGPRPTDIAGIELGNVPGLEDLPEESQQDLVAAAEIHTLSADEEVSGFELALVLDGVIAVMPAIADVAAAQAQRGELIFSQGHLQDGLPIRVVAGRSGAKVASFSASAFEAAVRDCPWVGDELKNVGDRLQTLAGVAMGPMGEELDDMLRGLVIERCEVRRLLPNEVIAPAGKPVPGMVIVGAGRIELVDDNKPGSAPLDELGPGSFVYAAQILQASPAPHTARAGDDGALILFAERKVAHELMVSVPPLLGIFAR
ncbi:MAG: cyclic nucleotide-binding domain-containing protein [Myxococcota bacterium]